MEVQGRIACGGVRRSGGAPYLGVLFLFGWVRHNTLAYPEFLWRYLITVKRLVVVSDSTKENSVVLRMIDKVKDEVPTYDRQGEGRGEGRGRLPRFSRLLHRFCDGDQYHHVAGSSPTLGVEFLLKTHKKCVHLENQNTTVHATTNHRVHKRPPKAPQGLPNTTNSLVTLSLSRCSTTRRGLENDKKKRAMNALTSPPKTTET